MRTKEEVQNEYTQLCAKAGEIVFMADELSHALAKKHEELTEIGKQVALVKAEYKALTTPQPPKLVEPQDNEADKQAQQPAAS